MSRLSKAFKRLKGRSKQTKSQSAVPVSSVTEVVTSQPLQSNSKPSSEAHKKTYPAQKAAQGPNRLDSASEVSLQEPLPYKPPLQSAEAVPPISEYPRPVSAFTEEAVKPKAQSALIAPPKQTLQCKPRCIIPDTKQVENQFAVQIAPRPPRKVTQQPTSSAKAPTVDPQRPRASKPTIIAQKAKPQPTPEATPKAHKTTPRLVATSKPAVQTHAGLYSGFTPSVAAVDHPCPKTFSEAQKTALNVLNGASPPRPRVSRARYQYTRQDDYKAARNIVWDEFSGPPTSSGFSKTSYVPYSPYPSAGPSKPFRTGGNLGGEEYFSTGGAIGGVAYAQTGGRFGEGSVSKTGGSLGEALGVNVRKRCDWSQEPSDLYPYDDLY
jgi:hypothetical protein